MTVAVAAPPGEVDQTVAGVRAFNRFYTRLIGVLDEGLARSAFSLTEARVLFELAHAPADGGATDVAGLRERLGLDSGYLSRIVARFERDDLVERARSAADARRVELRLTGAGRAAFAELDAASAADVRALVEPLEPAERRRVLAALRTVERAFGGAGRAAGGGRTAGDGRAAGGPAGGLVVLREPDPGDHGWVIERNAAVYAREFGWDASYEALVARIVAGFLADHDPRRERAWIAEVDGERAGCVYCVREDDETARLRLLLVEPAARGRGIGGRLVDECLRFARRAGYRRITLWTNDVLTSARRIYEAGGFRLDDQAPHHSFGQDLVGQNWSREL